MPQAAEFEWQRAQLPMRHGFEYENINSFSYISLVYSYILHTNITL
jgi:hypothetical protein